MYRILNKAANGLTIVVIGVAVVLVGTLLIPRVFGYQIYAVLSGSMEPCYHVGSVIYVKEASADQIKEGDPVAFHSGENVIVTHRVVSIDQEKKRLIMKGDANRVTDPKPVSFDQVIGIGKFSIPFLGYLAIHMQKSNGVFVCIGILTVMILLQVLIELMKPMEKKADEKANDQKDKEMPAHAQE